jgi:hypothetical protein
LGHEPDSKPKAGHNWTQARHLKAEIGERRRQQQERRRRKREGHDDERRQEEEKEKDDNDEDDEDDEEEDDEERAGRGPERQQQAAVRSEDEGLRDAPRSARGGQGRRQVGVLGQAILRVCDSLEVPPTVKGAGAGAGGDVDWLGVELLIDESHDDLGAFRVQG